ncbi:tRNA pseudouridine(54/55) synthase Pus10 [Candidatus Acetothermia bacterium]|nr:tRNA pseudouridine(54/55) synthase Pus10 [Candidatus Acetothermia bacterium]MBI3643254.1 tRNA pseudouridine(54/55) synthase Pus10 [Candidatus Acetothermia bacterium]
MKPLIEMAREILANEVICDHCLGRCFAKLGTALSVEERGRALRVLYAMESGKKPDSPAICSICNNLFEQVAEWSRLSADRIEGVEFAKYLVGTRPPENVVRAEQSFWSRYAIPQEQVEPFKQEFNRLVGKRFGQAQNVTGREIAVDFNQPEVVFLIDLERKKLEIEIHSLYIYGRYQKFVRNIPQTIWPCRKCKGKGCAHCKGTGKQYPESVGELIAAPVLEAAKSKEHAFHGAGREDIDARMLGTGRPFVLEIKSPKVRTLKLAGLKSEINATASGKVEAGDLHFVSRKVVEEIKEGKAQKSYRAKVTFEKPINSVVLNGTLAKLTGKISQQTPERVLHRRANLTRWRYLFSIQGELLSPTEAMIELRCDGGLYVKELISGDGGRTDPNLAELLGFTAKIIELDVMDVSGDFPDLF